MTKPIELMPELLVLRAMASDDQQLIEQLELSKKWIQLDPDKADETIPVNKTYLTGLIDAMLKRLKK
jgi:hypothetical protein